MWERRAPFGPQHVRRLVRNGVTVLVQPSNRRAYPMQVKKKNLVCSTTNRQFAKNKFMVRVDKAALHVAQSLSERSDSVAREKKV